MKKSATWKLCRWFYYFQVFVMISKSDKNRYKYEIFADGQVCLAEYPFRTEDGAKRAAKKFIDDGVRRGYPPEPLTFEELLARKERLEKLKI